MITIWRDMLCTHIREIEKQTIWLIYHSSTITHFKAIKTTALKQDKKLTFLREIQRFSLISDTAMQRETGFAQYCILLHTYFLLYCYISHHLNLYCTLYNTDTSSFPVINMNNREIEPLFSWGQFSVDSIQFNLKIIKYEVSSAQLSSH